MIDSYRRALDVALEAAAEAAALLLGECQRETGPRGSGGHCPADDEAERLIRSRLLAAFPTFGYLGEETGEQASTDPDRHLWLVDPNDGTRAMLQGFRGHAVSIALLRNGMPVLGVVHAVDAPDDAGDCFAWAEGCGPLTRNGTPVPAPLWPSELGPGDVVLVSQAADRHPAGNLRCVSPARFLPVASIAYRLALVAVGEAVAGVSLNGPCGWDYGAGHALLRGAGGVLIDQSGREVTYTADGHSGTVNCFGGAPQIVRELCTRPWHRVEGSGFGDAAPPDDLRPVRLALTRTVQPVDVVRRAQGCLLGQVVGDALGALVEFQSAASIEQQYPDGGPSLLADGGPHRIMAGQPTDDSELALILARTLVAHGPFNAEAVAAAYARWYHGWTHQEGVCHHRACRPFDVGNTTARALGAVGRQHLEVGTAADVATRAASTSSQANGALMRISPLGIWGWRQDEAVLAEAARADARLTHPHQVCQDASAVFTIAIARAIKDRTDAQETYDRAVMWAREHGIQPSVVQALEQSATVPPSDYQGQQGWVIIALQNAFYRLLHASTLEDAVVQTVRAGGDTDTNAAICGALVGAVHGRDAVPGQWQRMVLSCRAMSGHAQIRQPRPAQFWPVDALTLAELLLR
ncbi:MAG: ADP-ribosylglycohydrolase family protein [Chloroflexi bacterium]|nr:ADP-ribosylglycohydrolase family protein [Chloroflexota bacterium]